MFLKVLYIKNDEELIREIKFHKGLNLIVDETPGANLQKSGNSVGKTTVIRLVDYCLDSNGKNIWYDHLSQWRICVFALCISVLHRLSRTIP